MTVTNPLAKMAPQVVALAAHLGATRLMAERTSATPLGRSAEPTSLGASPDGLTDAPREASAPHSGRPVTAQSGIALDGLRSCVRAVVCGVEVRGQLVTQPSRGGDRQERVDGAPGEPQVVDAQLEVRGGGCSPSGKNSRLSNRTSWSSQRTGSCSWTRTPYSSRKQRSGEHHSGCSVTGHPPGPAGRRAGHLAGRWR
jgi:hypothetical protein